MSDRADHGADGATTITAREDATPNGPQGRTIPHDRLVDLLHNTRLTPVQRRIAHYILENPGQVIFLDAYELAAATNVSQASVTRFAQTLGFEGYPSLLSELRQLGVPYEEPEASNILQDGVSQEIRNLHHLRDTLGDEQHITELGRHLSASNPLVVLGLRASAPVAEYFAFFAAKIHPNVRQITQSGTTAGDQLEQAAASGASWALAFALPRCPREMLQLVNQAQRLRISVLAITDVGLNPVRQRANESLTVTVGSRMVFDSYAAPAVLASVLLEALADAAPQQTQERLLRFEETAAEDRYFTQ